MTDPVLACDRVAVRYGCQQILQGVDLTLRAGEILALLGPSGSGKTTLLHAVAGFTALQAGTVRIGGRTVTGPGRQVAPHQRDMGMMFQHYALWPHMLVIDVVAYPLRRQGESRPRARERARQLLEQMEIEALAWRYPDQLSGGQQQRVGLARALARDPRLYLLDEPTAHLDAHLRMVFQQEVAARCRAAGAAALYATHDAGEAFGLADRVALLRAGRLLQLGSPSHVYQRPVDVFSARLTGPATSLRATAARIGDEMLRVRIGEVDLDVPGGARDDFLTGVTVPVTLLVRPDWAELGGPLPATVRTVRYQGPHTDHLLETPGGVVIVRAPGPPRRAAGEHTGWHLRHAWALPADELPGDQPSGMAAPE
jgi:ABC-type Fe3+/spermidine/putrescine transport system ATPase subunit